MVTLRQPTLLLVHGAWHGAWIWEKVEPQLTAHGWQVHTVELPSTANDGPRAGLYDDAAVVRQSITDIGGPVVVVAHSYGGAVVSEGAAGLPNVRHLLFVCAFQLDVGETLLEVAGGEPPPLWHVHGDTIATNNPHDAFFADVPSDDAAAAVARLRPFSWLAVTQPLTVAAWHTVPSTYIITDQDMALVEGQEFFAARATYVRHLPTGHSPFLAAPSALTQLIIEAACTTAPLPN
jgi:pimeloyl-ACP methyl ester carboxylesterase